MFNEGWCTDQQERGTVKLRGKGETARYSKHVGPFQLQCNSIQRNCCRTLVHLLVVCQGCRWRAQGRRRKGTTEISVLLLSYRSKGNARDKTIPSSFNYIPLIKVQNGSTHHMCGANCWAWSWLPLFLHLGVDRFCFFVCFSFFLLVLKPSSECTHTA